MRNFFGLLARVRGCLSLWSTTGRSVFALTLAILCAAAAEPASGAEVKIPFQDKEIVVSGATWKKINEGAENEELLLYFKTAGEAAKASNYFILPLGAEGRILAVGGGGGGGTIKSSTGNQWAGGGGGGGGEVVDRTVKLTAQKYTLCIGAGGAGASAVSVAKQGTNGDPTYITGETSGEYLRVNGGGGGGGQAVGSAGGSGGGSSANATAMPNGGASTCHESDGHGNVGGGSIKGYAGGGGGAGSAGVTCVSGASAGGNGGAGWESDIDPDSVIKYGGGGGGGATVVGKKGGTGQDGGGNGGTSANSAAGVSTAGTDGRGGGGGGGGWFKPGSKGGSGIIIIRITYLDKPMVWKDIEIIAGGNKGTISVDENADVRKDGNDLVISYTNANVRGGLKVGTAEVPVWATARVLVVGGGGGGGMINGRIGGGGGGGGGAGGYVEKQGLVFDNTVEFSIMTGRGGKGGSANMEAGENGESSSLKTNNIDVVDVALGGGGGGAYTIGSDGASGGGGSRDPNDVGGRAGGHGEQGGNGGDAVDGNYVGGGGGGAGGDGGKAQKVTEGGKTVDTPGDGGAGRSSDITGMSRYYAGGGGGAAVNAATLANPMQGGRGGNKVGGNGAGVEGGVAVAATDGAANTGSGGGGGTSHSGATTPAGNGADGIVIIRLSGFVVKDIPLPKAQGPFTYDGNAHTGVVEFFAYTLTPNRIAKNADVYVVTATIPEGKPYKWADATEDPATWWGDRKVTWRINQLEVVVPKRLAEYDPDAATAQFNDKVQTAIDDAFYHLDDDGYCYTNVVAGVPLKYCRLDGHQRTDAGTTNFTATLCNYYYDREPNETNFIWQSVTSGSKLDPQKVKWRIAPADNAITSLTLADWQEETTNTLPTCSWTWQRVTTKYPKPDQVTYQWRKEGTKDWSEAKTVFDPPREYGPYELRAHICKDSNHEPGNWVEAESVIRFCIWRHPSKTMTDYVDIDITDSKNPVKVTLREAVNGGKGGGLPGFTYARAGETGSALRFVAISNLTSVAECDKDNPLSRDALLAYTNVTWDVKGASEIWVSAPPNTTSKLRLYWHRNPSEEIRADKLAKDAPQTAPGTTGSFGLVNRPDGENLERRVWVNWWKTEPTLKRYWDVDKLTPAAVKAGCGSLFAGVVTNKFVKMPDEVEVAFPDPSQIGAYSVEFYLFDSEGGVTDYPGPHILFDGTRVLDLEIVGHAPSPIDPGGPLASTLTGRILLANDDTTEGNAVAGQSYWRTKAADTTLDPWWERDGHEPPAEPGVNLLRGINHTMKHAAGAVTNTLWTLKDVYIGNLMSTNDTASVSNRFNALPWSASTSKGISSPEAEVAALTHREVGQLVMRNVGTSENRPDLCAYIASPAYTNGIGTVYFDVVNAYALADVKKACYGLVVEWTDNTNDSEFVSADWHKAPLHPMKVSNGTLTPATSSVDELDCLDVQNGGNLSKFTFYRVYAKIDSRAPARFRIRRTSVLTNEAGLDKEADDADGFILIDNVIASWPAPVPQLKETGQYDKSRKGSAVLGQETSFSVPYPSVGESFCGRARLEGGSKDNVSSARMHYRWRYADTEFDPARLNGRDAWRVVYFNVTNDFFATVSPLSYNGLHGDIEYWFDVTAFAPYYDYVDYSGQDLAAQTAAQSQEEPPKNKVTASTEGITYPSHGTNWFVRLREWSSPLRGYNFVYKTSESGAVRSVPMEMTGAKSWRHCLATTTAVDRLYVRLEGVSVLNPGAAELAFATNRWSFDSTDTVPKRLNRKSEDAWAQVPCDAKANYLLFQLDEDKESMLVARADWQDFNLWSSAMTNLFVGSAVETNATSYLAKEEEADYSAWPASVATNSAWSESFQVGAGQVAAVIYPRNEPFSSKRTLNGWTAENGLWTYGKWSLQNDPDPLLSRGDDSALQLEGRGKGRLSFIDNTRSPDGLDTITYSARIAQFNEFDNFSYYNKYTIDTSGSEPVVTAAIEMTNYTFVAAAALTETGAESFDGDGSVSLVGYYHPAWGCYEFRVSRGRTSTDLRLKLLRWSVQGGAYVSEELGYQDFDVADAGTGSDKNGINAGRLIKGSKTPLGGLFLSVEPSGDGTLVTAGVYRKDLSTAGAVSAMNNQKFAVVNYLDKSDSKLTYGTFGVLTCNCPGVIVKPSHYTQGVGAMLSPAADTFRQAADQEVTFTGTFTEDKLEDAKGKSTWVMKPGRLERLAGHDGCWGFQAKAVTPQQVVVQISESGKADWKDAVTNEVRGFANENFVLKVRDSRQCDVRLQLLGSSWDVRTDVVVDNVELTQWNGQWTKNYDVKSYDYLKDKFVYTSAWVVEADGKKAVRLQPTRGKRNSNGDLVPVSLRSPLLRGLGLFNFKWRNADSRAKLLVQVNEYVTWDGNLKNLTETTAAGEQASGSWETIETLDFSDPESGLGASGSKTVNINRRYHGREYGQDYYYGLVRVVVANDVEEAALATVTKRDHPEYGQVEITEAYAWDLPEYDACSWSGWNFRTAGWDGADPDTWANLTDGLRGLSGLLNNSVDPVKGELADREKSHYALKSPGIQSPAFRTNCVGAVSFRARLYAMTDIDSSGHAAVVTVYGTSQLDPKTGEPKDGTWEEAGDVIVSNRVYTSFSVKLKTTKNFKAVRLAVKGVPDVVAGGTAPAGYDPPNRVALDDICLWERQPQSIAFRRDRVRPFRDAAAIKTHLAVVDIDSRNEQPIAGEAFGFQAEVVVQDEEELELSDPNYPITVDLWYYTGSEPWGYDNWKTNAGAVRVTLTRAEEPEGQTNFIFRSTVESTASLCPPQVLETGETHRLVQYHLVAHYYDKSHDEGLHDLTKDEEWTPPAWYKGFTDPNATASFSAYTLLETIAPNRAWINEVNFTEDTKDHSAADQWVEIAVPSGVDMTGWKLKLYERDGYIADLLTFGDGCPASKQVSGDPSHYDFYVVKSPKATLAADATWRKFTVGSVDQGTLNYSNPYGFELVRPSGVIEHSAVVQGWNQYRDQGYKFAYLYDGTNLVSTLKEAEVGGDWVWAAEDFHLMPQCTVGVTNNQGLVHEDWHSPMGRTPGGLNEGQYIDPNWFVRPNGGYVWIYSSVLGGNMRQIIGGKTNTVGTLTVQSGVTTSIVYEVDRWYKLGTCEVTPSWGSVSGPTVQGGKSYYTLHLPDVSNQLDVTASAAISDAVAAMIPAAGKAYEPAIMNWLKKGTTGGADGGEYAFRNPDGPIIPAWYRGGNRLAPLPENETNRLDLVGMYWLDLDPTSGGWELWGNMGDMPEAPGSLGEINCSTNRVNAYGDVHTNILSTVWLQLTNTLDHVAYAPYRLQGLGNEQSDNFSGTWTSVTFQVAMHLVSAELTGAWRSMRYFVFDKGSFRAPDDPVSPYAARIEVIDPFSRQSPAWEWGWWKYADRGLAPFTKWRLTSDVTPAGVSNLKKNDFYEF